VNHASFLFFSNIALEASNASVGRKVKASLELIRLAKVSGILFCAAVLIRPELTSPATALVANGNAGAVDWLAVVFAVVVLEAAVPVEAAVVVVKPQAVALVVVALEGVVGCRAEAGVAEMFLVDGDVVGVCGCGEEVRSESREDQE